MILGIDFDNTIVCYESLFTRASLDLGLISPGAGGGKVGVRDHLRGLGRNNDWIVLQGIVYGPRMGEATPFPGFLPFLKKCRVHRIPVRIISHKTRYAESGERHDLHMAASRWLEQHHFFDTEETGLSPAEVSFNPTREAKLAAIVGAGCTHFIDDLPEVFAETGFPRAIERYLFDPQGIHQAWADGRRVATWNELDRLLLPSKIGEDKPADS